MVEHEEKMMKRVHQLFAEIAGGHQGVTVKGQRQEALQIYDYWLNNLA